MLTSEPQKVSNIIYCEICDYKTSRVSHYNKHLSTRRHKMLTNVDNSDTKSDETIYACVCGRQYKHRQSLSLHKKKCTHGIQKPNAFVTMALENELDYKDMFFKLLDNTSEIQAQLSNQQKQITEMIPKIGNNNNNNNSNNSNNTVNQKFNIKVFLNEQCKDAMNMSDFIKNIEITMANLDTTRYKGLAEGLSCAIIENMAKVSLHERPIHCTDLKRDAVHIKNDDVWVKDNSEKTNLRKAIKDISVKQFKTLQTWTHQNPGFKDDDAKSVYFAHAVSNVSKDPATVSDKVIKRICNAVYLKDSLD